MNKQEFVAGMKMLSGVYVDDRLVGENVLNVWYHFFAEYSSDVFLRSVNDMCRENEKRPSVHELIVKCNKVKKDIEREVIEQIENEESVTDEEWEEEFYKRGI